MELLSESADREKNLRTLDDMDETIGTFLSFARASGEAEEKSRIDLGALVATVCDDLADLGATVDCSTERALVVSCKRVAIKRAVTNLVENAIKYGHEARVQVARSAARAVITVEDRGPGIADGQVAAVLSPFYRAETAQILDPRGVGLGLSIAQAIVEDHGGELVLANRPQGGLRVEIHLPL